ncbi:MAG TPA: fused MFS/spermidine synthase [Pseudobacteroides sp.]|uniref:spermidine synthase n=1 Tax=Pseudobacteroides sp. TaxID=1968840 RepID=UPI002F922272
MSKNIYIYLTAFFCGMSVMAVELSATRLLAPTFGTSSIIWTIVIGLIMISMSLGNILGGRSADKYNSMDRLYALIWAAAIYIGLIPFVGKYIIILSVTIFMWVSPDNLVVSGSILSCLIIFSIPLVILGMVTPYLVKLGITDINKSGKTAGEIYALSTIGSIIGTFIPTFITIPLVGTSKTFLIFSLILNLICLYYFVSKRIRLAKSIISSVIILALTVIPFHDSYAFWKQNIVYEGESKYNYLQVSEDSKSVILSTNVAFGVQSIYKKNSVITNLYYDYALMAPLFMKNVNFNSSKDVLILGLGTGTYAKQLKHFFPNVNTDGVEIDPKIVDLSKKYFNLKDNEANIYINDGRTFLNTHKDKKYDLIMVDAYHDITIPFHMSTKEFFALLKESLKPDGIIVVNINIRSKKDSQINDYICQTIKSQMEKVYKCELNNSTNTIVFASRDENSLNFFLNNSESIEKQNPLKGISEYVKANLTEINESKLVFTDEVAPVEIMGQKVLDEIVANELESFKNELNSGKGFWDNIMQYLR